MFSFLSGKPGEYVETAFGQYWTGLVEAYVGLKLTNRTDLLPALSGIAKYVQDMNSHTGRYVSGLWERDIVLQLSWRRNFALPDFEFKADEILHSPTFSWTAASRPVS